MRVADTEVIIVGAGPAGLMLAAELCLAGVRPLILERQPQPRETPKASGFNGQIVELLRYRGLLDRIEAASARPVGVARGAPFGGMELDFSHLTDPPMRVVHLPQPRLERLLGEHADELGVSIRRGHEVVGVSQDDAAVTAAVRGPDGPYQVTARYLVGCDGAHSKVRDTAGIPFPGTTYPEVNRLAQVAVPGSVTQLDNGGLDVPGLGRIQAGFTRTEHGVFAFGQLASGALLIQTTEDEPAGADTDAPMTLTELRDSIRRVLGADLPLGEATRLSRYGSQARQAERYRDGRILLAGDAAHQFPATGIGINSGMLDAANLAWKLAAAIGGWAPAGLLDTYHRERHFAGARALLQTQAQVALRRGQDPAAEALRELFAELLTDEQPSRRVAALIAGTDIRYPMPGPGQHDLAGTFAPDLTLYTSQGTTSVAEFMHTARPVFLDLADRPDLRETAQDWRHRVDIHTARTDHPPADAILIRPDAYIAWAAASGEPAGTAGPALREALSGWLGAPLKTTVPVINRFHDHAGLPSAARFSPTTAYPRHRSSSAASDNLCPRRCDSWAMEDHRVVAVILRRGEQLLLCHRSPGRRWFPDVWDFPGGHVEPGERPEDALRREVAEELGAELEGVDGGPVLHRVVPQAGLDLTVWVSWRWRGTVSNLQPEEHDAIGWFEEGQLDGLRFADPSYLPLLRRLLSV